MYVLARPFIELCLLRLAPQDLPRSPLLLALALVAHVLIGIALLAFRLDPGQAFLAGVTGTVLLCVLTTSLLLVNGLSARVLQTLTALAGADVVVGLAAVPVTAWLHGSVEHGAAAGLPGLLFLALLVWNLAIAGHVLRHAMSTPLAMGLVLALLFYVISVSTMGALFPGMG